MSLAAPKVLLLELAERAAVATTVQSTPGAQHIWFNWWLGMLPLPWPSW
jgi:hypothetical protein